MATIDDLAISYGRFVGLPWSQTLSGAERVWCALYAPEHERRIRKRLSDFEQRTVRAQHRWVPVDFTDAFAQWMSAHDYQDEYFAAPELLEETALEPFALYCADRLRDALVRADNTTVVVMTGVASLFGLARVSRIIEAVAESIGGRLLIFFPGTYADHRYRLLDARDGWNYRATRITVGEEATA